MPGLALWFAALFGLSSLAIRTSLFEAMVMASGIDRIVPAAAPPLGHAARLLLALAFALVGAALGWVVARAIAGLPDEAEAEAHPVAEPVWQPEPYAPPATPVEAAAAPDTAYQVRARDAHPDAPARRPILAREELRHAEFAAPIEAAETLTPAQAETVTSAPVQSETVPYEPVAHAIPPAPPAAVWEDDAPVLGPARDGSAAPADQAPVLGPAHQGAATVAEPEPPVREAEPLPAIELPPAAAPVPPVSAAQRIAGAAPTELSHVELIERLALAMQRREAAVATGTPAEPEAPGATAEALRATLNALKGASHG